MMVMKGVPLAAIADGASQFIDGSWVRGEGAKFAVTNPSDGSRIAEIPEVSCPQVEAAIRAARRSFDGGWRDASVADRVAVLRRFTAALARRRADILDLVIAEAGCPRNSPFVSVQVERPIEQGDEIIDLFLSLPEVVDNPLPLNERITPFGTTIQSLRRYQPIGVVAAIAAYNYPFFTALWKVLPALVTGNTVVLRPSPLTPLSALFFAEAAEEAGLPAGVLNVVLEHGLDGAKLLTTHPDVDMVAFTGSTAVGIQVMAQAAPSMKRLQLELGGKSAQIFLPDAAAQAKQAAAGVCAAHAGQGCALGTRIFVPEDRKQEVLEGMAAAVGALVVGGTEDPGAHVGPVISEAQVRRCEHFVALAVEAGARVVAGGKRPAHLAQGHFFEPTVLDVADNTNPAAQEEIFGPVVCVIPYDGVDDAVRIANDSPFGLAGGIWSADPEAALGVARRIRTGTLSINGAYPNFAAPFGGFGQSGIGREFGSYGIDEYVELKSITL